MKKINILLILSLSLFTSLLVSSCGKDFLDKTPEGDYVADKY